MIVSRNTIWAISLGLLLISLGACRDKPRSEGEKEKNALQNYVEVPLDKAKAVGGIAEQHERQIHQQLDNTSGDPED